MILNWYIIGVVVADHIHFVEDTAIYHVRDCGPGAHLVEEQDPTEHKTTVKTRVVVPGYLQITDETTPKNDPSIAYIRAWQKNAPGIVNATRGRETVATIPAFVSYAFWTEALYDRCRRL